MVAEEIRSYEISKGVGDNKSVEYKPSFNYFFMKSIKMIQFLKRKSLCNFMRKQLLEKSDSSYKAICICI